MKEEGKKQRKKMSHEMNHYIGPESENAKW